MNIVLASWIGGGLLATWCIWKLSTSFVMQQRINRAVFYLGYQLYVNTRFGRWFNNRHIRKANVKYGEDGHSKQVSFTYGGLKIWPIPCIFDNYAYVVMDTKTNDAVVVDAGDGAAVSEFLEKHSMTPKAILTTHRHWDHSGGNKMLKKQYSSISIHGSGIDKPDGVTRSLRHEETISIGSLEFVAYSTPGHTRGHMIYLLKGERHGSTADCLFTGDLLFLAGCGKNFEGTAEDILGSLDLVRSLPGTTLIWPGHEYAIADLIFAFTCDSENSVVQEKLSWARNQRLERLPTCPSTLTEEKQYNLFLRTGDVNLLRILGITSPEDPAGVVGDTEKEPLTITKEQRVQAFVKLRQKKDGIM